MFMSRDQNAGRSHSMKIDDGSFEWVEEFKYLATTLTNPNSIQEEIKSRLKSGNACYHSVQNLLSSSLPSKNLKIKIYRTIILPVVLFLSKRDEATREWTKLHNEKLNDLYSSPNIVRVVKSRRMRWVGHVARMWERRCVYRVLVGK